MPKRPGTYVYRDYTELLDGDILAGLVLSQIVFWYQRSTKTGKPKLRVRRNHLWWVAKSNVDWERECGLSPMQSRRAIKILKEKGLIVTEVFKFAGAPTQHLRLVIAKGKSVLETPPTAEELKQTLAATGTEGQIHLLPGSNPSDAGDKSYTDTTTDTTTDLSVTSHATGNVVSFPEKNSGEEEWGGRRKTDRRLRSDPSSAERRQQDRRSEPMSVEKVLQQQKDRPNVSLAALWQRRMAAVYGGFQKPLSGKELGQLKQLQKYLGPQTRDVVDFAFNHWQKVGSTIQTEAGLATYPAIPNLGLLLKYCGVAMNLYLQSVAPAPPSPPPALDEPVYDVPQAKEAEEPPHKLTAEELAEMLAGLDE